MIVKTRKQGNSLMITIPSHFNIPTGKEYDVNLSKTGEIIFTPKESITVEFSTDKELNSYVDDIFSTYDDVFKELVEK
ncbi:type II toxin-antitoxin system PemI/MazE family antitoxin [Streptococcus uberis]|uniref:type II toxin-antitoxin system PemI/MazE family antitoxin n=1 Tax=Streptococcus uberis TaxID=1349 RepID=UPI002FE9418F